MTMCSWPWAGGWKAAGGLHCWGGGETRPQTFPAPSNPCKHQADAQQEDWRRLGGPLCPSIPLSPLLGTKDRRPSWNCRIPAHISLCSVQLMAALGSAGGSVTPWQPAVTVAVFLLGTGCRCRTTVARLGSRVAWHCRAPNSAPVTLTMTTVSASVPRCSREVSGAGGHPHAAPVSASLKCHLPTLLPSHRMVVRCLWPLQPEWHLLPGPEQRPKAQRHPLAPLPGAQLLAEGHPHDDPTLQLLTGLQPLPALREVWDKGWLGAAKMPQLLQGTFAMSYIFLLLFIPFFRSLRCHHGHAGGAAGRGEGRCRSWSCRSWSGTKPDLPKWAPPCGNPLISPQLLSLNFCWASGFCPGDKTPRSSQGWGSENHWDHVLSEGPQT